MIWLIAALVLSWPGHEPHVKTFDTQGERVTAGWQATPTLHTHTFTATDKATEVVYPYQLNRLLGDGWLVPSHMGRRISDSDFAADFTPRSFHFPGANSRGEHLIAPFVIRMDTTHARLIALLSPTEDVQINVSRGRVAFVHPRLEPGATLTVQYVDDVFDDWYAAVDRARELYGLTRESDALYHTFWRPGYFNVGLMNTVEAALRDGFPITTYYEHNLDALLGWAQVWGQMSDHRGECCARRVGFHPRYQNPMGLVPVHGDIGYYARTGEDESLTFYDEMVAAVRDRGGASIIYWDIVGMKRTVPPAEIVKRAAQIPTFIEGASYDLPLASMMGHQTLTTPDAFPELGRYFLKNRPLFMGYANVGMRELVWQVYHDAIELGCGLDAWFFYDPTFAAFLTSALEEWQRVGFWADKPQLVRRGVFKGDSGKIYTVTIENKTTKIAVALPG